MPFWIYPHHNEIHSFAPGYAQYFKWGGPNSSDISNANIRRVQRYGVPRSFKLILIGMVRVRPNAKKNDFRTATSCKPTSTA